MGNGNTCGGSGVSYCCGDGTCEGDENSFNCEVDCGPAPSCGDSLCDGGAGEDQCSCADDCGTPLSSEAGACADGVDNDCDGLTECSDGNCAADPACEVPTCDPIGATCSNNADCCSNKCRGKGGSQTCR